MQHVVGQAQLFGRNQDDLHPLVARQRLDERMNRAAEFQVAAETDGQMVEAAFLALDGQQVGQRLRGMGRDGL